MNKIAVVILNWNGSEMLRTFLPSVIEHSVADGGVEICVADNASTDDSVALLEAAFPSVRIIRLEKKLWLCRWVQFRLATGGSRVRGAAQL